MIHWLKSWPEAFRPVVNGMKTHEVRVNDRQFAVGDRLHLLEWDPEIKRYTGWRIDVLVTHVTPGGRFGLPKNLDVLSIRILTLPLRRQNWTGDCPWPEAA